MVKITDYVDGEVQGGGGGEQIFIIDEVYTILKIHLPLPTGAILKKKYFEVKKYKTHKKKFH